MIYNMFYSWQFFMRARSFCAYGEKRLAINDRLTNRTFWGERNGQI